MEEGDSVGNFHKLVYMYVRTSFILLISLPGIYGNIIVIRNTSKFQVKNDIECIGKLRQLLAIFNLLFIIVAIFHHFDLVFDLKIVTCNQNICILHLIIDNLIAFGIFSTLLRTIVPCISIYHNLATKLDSFSAVKKYRRIKLGLILWSCEAVLLAFYLVKGQFVTHNTNSCYLSHQVASCNLFLFSFMSCTCLLSSVIVCVVLKVFYPGTKSDYKLEVSLLEQQIVSYLIYILCWLPKIAVPLVFDHPESYRTYYTIIRNNFYSDHDIIQTYSAISEVLAVSSCSLFSFSCKLNNKKSMEVISNL